MPQDTFDATYSVFRKEVIDRVVEAYDEATAEEPVPDGYQLLNTDSHDINYYLMGDPGVTFDPSQKTYVVTHGWNSANLRSQDWQALLNSIRNYDPAANILFVEWTAYANTQYDYQSAANDTDNVGDWVADYLQTLNLNPSETTLIGHSLGGHVMGNVGSAYAVATGSKFANVIALDPAGPKFEGSDGKSDDRKLSLGDADRVVVLHSTETLGYNGSRGHLDLYLNDWQRDMQPGTECLTGMPQSHRYPILLLEALLQGQSFVQGNSDVLDYQSLFTWNGDRDITTAELNVGIASPPAQTIIQATGTDAGNNEYWNIQDYNQDGITNYEDLEEVIRNGINGGNGYDPDQFGLTRLQQFINDNISTITVTADGFNIAGDFIFYINFNQEFTATSFLNSFGSDLGDTFDQNLFFEDPHLKITILADTSYSGATIDIVSNNVQITDITNFIADIADLADVGISGLTDALRNLQYTGPTLTLDIDLNKYALEFVNETLDFGLNLSPTHVLGIGSNTIIDNIFSSSIFSSLLRSPKITYETQENTSESQKSVSLQALIDDGDGNPENDNLAIVTIKEKTANGVNNYSTKLEYRLNNIATFSVRDYLPDVLKPVFPNLEIDDPRFIIEGADTFKIQGKSTLDWTLGEEIEDFACKFLGINLLGALASELAFEVEFKFDGVIPKGVGLNVYLDVGLEDPILSFPFQFPNLDESLALSFNGLGYKYSVEITDFGGLKTTSGLQGDLTLEGYDPVKTGEPALSLIGGVKNTVVVGEVGNPNNPSGFETGFAGFFNVDALGGAWTNPFGIPDSEFRQVAIQTSFGSTDNTFGFIGGLEFGNYNFDTVIYLNSTNPAASGFGLTLNEPISIIDLFLGPVGSYAATQLSDRFEEVEDIFDLLNSIFDLTIQSFDSDGDGDLNPLFYYMPEDVNIAGESFGTGLYINGAVNAWGWEGRLAFAQSGGLFGSTDYTGSLALERLDLGGLGWFVIEGVDDPNTPDDESAELNFDFQASSGATGLMNAQLNADGALTLFGYEVGTAYAKVGLSGIDIDVDIDFFNVLEISGDLFVGNPKGDDSTTITENADGTITLEQSFSNFGSRGSLVLEGETQSTSLKFDGIDDYVQINSDRFSEITSAITIETWVKVDSFTKAWQTLISKGDSSWRLHRYAGTDQLRFAITDVGTVDSSSSLNDGAWHHVAATYDGSSLKLYIDGELEGETAASGAIPTNTANMMLGANENQPGRNFYGQMDEIRIWNTARTQEEIQANLDRRLDPNQTGLTYYLPIDRATPNSNILNETFDGGLPKQVVLAPLTANQSGSIADQYHQIAPETLADHLQGHWTLDAISNGSVTNGGQLGSAVDGTVVGTPVTTDALAQDGGSALDFNGTTDGITIPDSVGINTDVSYAQRTISLWFKADSLEGQQVLYEEGGIVGGFNLFLDGDQLKLGAWSESRGKWLETPVIAGEAYQVVLSFDQGILRGYLNGESLGSVATGFAAMPAHTADIGVAHMNQDTRFFSVVDDFTPAVALSLNGLASLDSGVATAIGSPTAVASLLQNDSGSALAFNGSGDGIHILDNTVINTDSAGYDKKTIELWFQADRLTGQQVIYEQGGTANGLNLYLDDNILNLGAWTSNVGQWLQTVAEVGQTYHVVLQFDNGQLSGYINGNFLGQLTTDFTTIGSHTGDVALGYAKNDTRFSDGILSGDGAYFQGTIEGLNLYNEVISPIQITHNYRAGTEQFSGTGHYFDGVIDDLKLYPTVYGVPRTDAEILADYQANYQSGFAQGLTLETFNNTDLEGDPVTIAQISDLNSLSLDANTSQKITGYIKAPVTGNYTFTTTNAGGTRLTVDQVAVIDHLQSPERAIDLNNDSITIENYGGLYDFQRAMTVETWIKVDGNFEDTWEAIVTKGDNSWRLQRAENNQTVSFGVNLDGSTTKGTTSTSPLNDGQWHHVVGVYDGYKAQIYVDGILEGESNASSSQVNIQTNDRPVMIGGNADYPGREFDGKVGEVRLWDRALSGTEIAALHNFEQILTGSEENLVGYWNFEDVAIPRKIDDLSINGNDGRYNNSSLGDLYDTSLLAYQYPTHQYYQEGYGDLFTNTPLTETGTIALEAGTIYPFELELQRFNTSTIAPTIAWDYDGISTAAIPANALLSDQTLGEDWSLINGEVGHGFFNTDKTGAFQFVTPSDQIRSAISPSFDLSLGGSLTFDLNLLGPITMQTQAGTETVPSFNIFGYGNFIDVTPENSIHLDYSVDGGDSWTTLDSYNSVVNGAGWNRIKLDLPTAAFTDSTQFRWWQNNLGTFNYWALDNVAVIQNSSPTWQAISGGKVFTTQQESGETLTSNPDGAALHFTADAFEIVNPLGEEFQYFLRTNEAQLLAGDFNGDGKTDFISRLKYNWSGDNFLFTTYLSQGDGTYSVVDGDTSSNGADFDTQHQYHVGDFNGDGISDLLRQHKDTSANSVLYFGTSDGSFDKASTNLGTAIPSIPGVNLILGDYNGDGNTDLIRQEKGGWDDDSSNTFSVWFSNGNGTFNVFTPSGSDYQDGLKFDPGAKLIAGDFDGDGKTDFIRQEKGGWDDDGVSSFQVYFSNGDGTFTARQPLGDEYQWGLRNDPGVNIITGDFNGDGATDFLAQAKSDRANSSSSIYNNQPHLRVFLSRGSGTRTDGTFEMITPFTDSTGFRDDRGVNLITGDFNGDGNTDFIRQEKGTWDNDTVNTFGVYLSDGDGTFTAVQPDAPEYQAVLNYDKGANLIVGDFDGDGSDDFLRQERGDWDNDFANTFQTYLSNLDQSQIRHAITQPLDTRTAETLQFDFVFGPQYFEPNPFHYDLGTDANPQLSTYGDEDFSLTAGDAPEVGEDVTIAYSVDGGSTWTNLGTIAASDAVNYENWITVALSLPDAAKTDHTQFRWQQTHFTDLDDDTWALDNITLTTDTVFSGVERVTPILLTTEDGAEGTGGDRQGFTIEGNGEITLLGETLADVSLLVDKNGLKFDLLRSFSFGSLGSIDRNLSVRVGANGISITGELDMEFPLKVAIPVLGTLDLPDFGLDGELNLAIGTDGKVSGSLKDVDFKVWGKNLSIPTIGFSTNVTTWDDILVETSNQVGKIIKKEFNQTIANAEETLSNLAHGAIDFAGDAATFLANYTLGGLESLWETAGGASALFTQYSNDIGGYVNQLPTSAIISAIEGDVPSSVQNGIKKAGKKLTKLFNGPIAGGLVFLDTNGNLILDENEPFTLTDSYGRFDLDYTLADYDTNGDGILDPSEAIVIGVGGIETTTGQVFNSSFLAPVGGEVTPLTTLKTGLTLNGFTPDDAEQLIKESYGIDLGDIGLERLDLYAAIGGQEGDQQALLDLAVGNILAHTLLLFGARIIRIYQPELTGLAAESKLLAAVASVAQSLGTIAPESYEFNRQLLEQIGIVTNQPPLDADLLDGLAQLLTAGKPQLEAALANVIDPNQSLDDLSLVLPTLNYLKGVILARFPDVVEQIVAGELDPVGALDDLPTILLENNYLLEYSLNDDRVISVRSEGNLLEGNTAFHGGQFIVELGEPAPAQGLILFYNLSGTATHQEDYRLTSDQEGILKIAPYASSGIIELELLDDALSENTETITLSLQYASDGFALAPEARTAYLTIRDDENPNPIEGIAPTQVITGSINNDNIVGQPHSDWLKGSFGSDVLQGNGGNDRLDGGFGSDLLYGGDGDDALAGHFGPDHLFGEAGNDTLRGGTEADWLDGGEGSDSLQGNEGDDTLYGQGGNDELDGGTGNDYLSGGDNNDWLQGGLGHDILLGGRGDDLITGGAGADQFVIDDFSGDFDIFTDFDLTEGDRLVILESAVEGFDADLLSFGNGFLQYNDRNLALVQNEGQIYALLPVNQVVDVVANASALTVPDNPPAGSNSLTTGDVPSLDSLTTTAVDPVNSQGLLADILRRGTLRAAVTLETPDWQKRQAQALAAALFGDANAVEFVLLAEREILPAVANKTVDLSAHLFPQTTDPQVDFAPASVYRSDLIVVNPGQGITEPQDLDGVTIGVVLDTQNRVNLRNALDPAGIHYNLAEFATQAELLNAYERSEVAAIVLDNLSLNQQPAGSAVLNLELSVEPLALALPENESAWADVVRWVIQAPLVAESLGIDSVNLDSWVTTEDPSIQRFLGLTGDLGQSLGLSNNFATQVIRTLGNFDEFWTGAFPGTLRHRNQLASNDGLLYNLPFSGSAQPGFDVTDNNDRSVLAEVQARGRVKVGIVPDNIGFSVADGKGGYRGFDVDLGKAIAAALFGDPEAVEWVEQDKLERFTHAASGVVDVSASQATHNLVRDGVYGVDFSQIYLYTGQGILTRKDNGILNLPSLDGRRVGVIANTTSAQNLNDILSQYQSRVTYATYADSASLFAAYENGEVDAVTNDLPLLASAISTFADPDAHHLLNADLSQEPLAFVVDEDQSDWLDVVNLVLDTLTKAEELGITAANVQALRNSANPAIRQFLGVNGNLGAQLGLSPDFGVHVIQAVGNYGEIYDRNFNQDLLPRTGNLSPDDFGLQYGASFTNALSIAQPALVQRTNGIFQLVENLANLDVTLLNHDRTTIAEVGLFLVDNAQGTIAGLTPEDPDYIAAVLGRSQTLFSVLDDNPNGFSSENLTRTLGEFPANSYFGFYVVKGSDAETVLSTDQFSQVSLSRNTNALQVSTKGPALTLNWEIDGDADFGDLSLQVTPTLEGTPLGATLDKTIDLTGFEGEQTIQFTLNREAAYDNFVGFYRVNAEGQVLNADGAVVSGNPHEDSRYAQLALDHRLDFFLNAANQQTATFEEILLGGVRYAPILIADGGSPERPDLSNVYFAYSGANSDGVNHVRRMADNGFGFEDLFGGGDNDFNDVIMTAQLV